MDIHHILKTNKRLLKPLIDKLLCFSIYSAAKEQNLLELSNTLSIILPDIADQYTSMKIDTNYLRINCRVLHAFQISLAIKAIKLLIEQEPLEDKDRHYYIVDIGDSSGNHLIYLKTLLKNNCYYDSYKFETLSVNLDRVAVDKIRSKGLEALLIRAEGLYEKSKIKPDLFLSFETIEHLYNPISFLDNISKKSECNYFVLTVPYISQSRVGLHHIRHQQSQDVFPENTHIFELSPEDWKLIFQHSGWQVVEEITYRQYPCRSPLKLMKYYWRKYDFEGFYGVILKKDRSWAECYKS